MSSCDSNDTPDGNQPRVPGELLGPVVISFLVFYHTKRASITAEPKVSFGTNAGRQPHEVLTLNCYWLRLFLLPR